MAPIKKSSILDKLMILGVVFLVGSPLLFGLISPADWEYGRALELQRRGNLDEARKKYLSVLQSNPDHAMAMFRLGEIAYRDNDFELALSYGEKALSNAEPFQKPVIINLVSSSLVVLEQPRKAIEQVRKLHEFTSLPKEYAGLTTRGLIPLLDAPANRQFLNSLAYTMAISRVNLAEAEVYIDAIIRYYESRVENSLLTAAYLYERSSNYSQAFELLSQLVEEFESGLEKPRFLGMREQESREDQQKAGINLQSVEQNQSANDHAEGERMPAAFSGNLAEREFLFLANNRLMLLATKLQSDSVAKYSKALDRLRSSELDEDSCRLERDDKKFLELASELRHYYDTRAMVRLSLGDRFSAQAIRLRDQSIGRFLQVSELAHQYYQAGYRDLMNSINLRESITSYLKRFPANSLMITLPSDRQEFERENQRLQAVEHYHRFLLLTAIDRLDDAEKWLKKLETMGFEPGPTLF